jgi:hypothetical protein
MFGWISLASTLLQIVMAIMNYLERQRAINEGLAQAVSILVEKADGLINRADEYRNSVSDDPAVLLRDEYNRDREEGGSGADTNTVQIVLPSKVQPH